MTLTINCLVVTDDCGFIDVKSSFCRCIRFSAWKPLSHLPVYPAGNISERVKNPHLGSNDGNCAAQRLRKASRLGLYFANESPSTTQVHVIAQLPNEPYSSADRGKREHEDGYVESENLTDLRQYLAKPEFINSRPSVVALPSEWPRLKYQEMEVRILNDRPRKDVPISPIALLYRPFGEFLDRIRDYLQEDDGVDLKALELAVEDFASAMSRHYRS